MDIKKVDFQYGNNITVISEKQFDAHQTLYKGYVDKTNEITKTLQDDGERSKANAVYSKYRGLKESESFALDGVILHELYFQNIGGVSKERPADFLSIVNQAFGSYEKWQEDFIACATASRGWCILSYENRTKSFRNISLDAHNVGVVAMAIPLLIIDMYEHAYFIDYATDKASYIKNFLNNINWKVVEDRCKFFQ